MADSNNQPIKHPSEQSMTREEFATIIEQSMSFLNHNTKEREKNM